MFIRQQHQKKGSLLLNSLISAIVSFEFGHSTIGKMSISFIHAFSEGYEGRLNWNAIPPRPREIKWLVVDNHKARMKNIEKDSPIAIYVKRSTQVAYQYTTIGVCSYNNATSSLRPLGFLTNL